MVGNASHLPGVPTTSKRGCQSTGLQLEEAEGTTEGTLRISQGYRTDDPPSAWQEEALLAHLDFQRSFINNLHHNRQVSAKTSIRTSEHPESFRVRTFRDAYLVLALKGSWRGTIAHSRAVPSALPRFCHTPPPFPLQRAMLFKRTYKGNRLEKQLQSPTHSDLRRRRLLLLHDTVGCFFSCLSSFFDTSQCS